MDVGKTFNSSEDAKIGDVLNVHIAELLVDQREKGEWSIGWFLPRVDGVTNERPMTVDQIKSKAKPDEIRKTDGFDLAFKVQHRVLKAETVEVTDEDGEDKEEQFVLGVVLEPNDGDDGAPLDPDAQNDIYSVADIRRAAHEFMEKYQGLGLEHKTRLTRGQAVVVQSYLALTDMKVDGTKVREGTWLMGEIIKDAKLWKRIKDGKLTAFSIGGTAMRTVAGEDD